jgi:hypothetical protein
VHHAPAYQQYNYGRKKTDNKSHGNSVKFMIFNIPGKDDPSVGHKGTNAKTPQLLRRGQGNPGIEVHNLKNQDKNRQIRPVGNKGFKIYCR